MLTILPCLDSAEMAAARHRELVISTKVAAALGRSAVEAATNDSYTHPRGGTVDWSREVRAACAAKVSIPPDAVLPAHPAPPFAATRVQVTNETTLGAAQRLVARGLKPLALNFANGIQPGGGFLDGALAQEETLCRSSALYLTLAGDPMYAAHRRRPQPDSTAWAIYSPGVPVFRSDDGSTLDTPWLLSLVTCAAPYQPAIGQPAAQNLLKQRIRRVLAIAQAYGYTALVLGAWGCGAFHNDPWSTASDFRDALELEFASAFSDVVFAVTDWSPERKYLRPFCEVFAQSTGER